MRNATDQKTNDRRLGYQRLSCNPALTGNREGVWHYVRRDSRNKAIGAMGFGRACWSRGPNPSLITANTATYRCSATLNSLI